MLLKKADDKSKRLRLLEELQRSPRLDVEQRDWLGRELDRLRKGIQGEKEAAHYLDSYLADSENSVLMHDLRFVVEGQTAQIDHMLINRMGYVFLFETKNFNGNLRISPHGEFSVSYGQREYGIPSPIEQSRRHERILSKLFTVLEISPRVGSQFEFVHVVLVEPKATITRPDMAIFDSSMVIKADQFPQFHKQWVDSHLGFLKTLKALANVNSRDTVREWGERLLRQHRPADLLQLPEFMRPRTDAASLVDRQQPPTGDRLAESVTAPPLKAQPRTLVCAYCGSKISFAEGKFCWSHEARFKGLQYCREHQALMPRSNQAAS